MKYPYEQVDNGFSIDTRRKINDNFKDIESDIIETNQRVTSVDNEVNGRMDDIDKKVEDVNNKSVHFDDVDAELAEHAELLEQLKASSIDGEVIAARNGFPSLLDFLRTLDKGATIGTKIFNPTAGQTVIDLSDTGELQAVGKIIMFLIDGAPQWDSYTWTNPTTLTMKSPFAGTEKVVIRYFIGNALIRTGHNRSHEKGGFDELDAYKLYNGDVIQNGINSIGDVSAFETTGTTLTEKTRNEFNQRAYNLKKWESLKVAVSGGYDWSPAIQAGIKYLMELGGGCLLVPPEDYWGLADVYTHPSNLNPAFKNSPLTIKGTTPVTADLYNTVKKVPRFIKKQAGSFLGVNYNETTQAVLTGTGVYRNFTIKNIAFYGGGTYDTKYTKVMTSTMNVKGIEKHNSAINVEDCHFWAMDWGVFDPETVNNVDNYCDQSTYKRLGFSNMGTGWIQAYRSDASIFEAIYGYDMAISCKYGIRAKKGESFRIDGILCAGKAMHLAKNFKLVSLEHCNSVRVHDFYMERIEGLGIWLDSCKNITITEFGVRHYAGVFGRGVNNRNVFIDAVYSHVEENKALSPNDTGDYTTYDTITPPLNWDFDSTNTDIRYGREFYRNGVHSSTGFSETTARLTGRRNTTSKAIYQVGQQYIFDVIHNGTNFAISLPSGQVDFGTLFASSLPTFNSTTGELTFPTDGAFANISAIHVSGRRSGTGIINNAYKISNGPPVTVRLYNLSTNAIITNASDVAFSVTLHT